MTSTVERPVDRTRRVSPLAAALGIAILFGGFYSMELTGAGFSVSDNLTADQMLEQLDAARQSIYLGGGVQALIAMAVVVFGAFVRRALRVREPQDSLTPSIAWGGALMAGALLTVAAAVTQLSGGSEEAVEPAILLTLHTLQENLFAGGWCSLALTAGAVAYAGLARGSVARWLAGVSAFVGVLLLIAQVVVPWAGWFPALLWVAVASFGLRVGSARSAAAHG